MRVGQRGQAASAANRSPGIYIMVPVQLITAWAGAVHPVELQTKVRDKHNHREGLYYRAFLQLGPFLGGKRFKPSSAESINTLF